MLPKLQQTNFLGIPGPLRSEEALPGSSRDLRGAQCQGLMPPPPPPPPPPVPHPGELSPPAQRPAVLREGRKETPKRLTFGWHWVSPVPQWLVAVPSLARAAGSSSRRGCERPAHPAGRTSSAPLPNQPGPAGSVTASHGARTAPPAALPCNCVSFRVGSPRGCGEM